MGTNLIKHVCLILKLIQSREILTTQHRNGLKIRKEILIRSITQCLVGSLLTALNYMYAEMSNLLLY